MRERQAASPRGWAPKAAGRDERGKPRSRNKRAQEAETSAAPTGWGRAGALRAAGGGGVGGRDRMGGARGTLPGAVPQLTVPPSLMMIFLASMILRFAARFFFFPWVILPSSIPGAAAATPGAAGPSGECRPATTAGPSRSGRPPPS